MRLAFALFHQVNQLFAFTAKRQVLPFIRDGIFNFFDCRFRVCHAAGPRPESNRAAPSGLVALVYVGGRRA